MSYMTVSVEVSDIVESLSIYDVDEVMELILRLDLKMADADFTEELITKLIKSLRSDVPVDEINNFLEELKQ